MALSRLVSLDSAPDMNIYIYIFFCYSVTCCAALHLFYSYPFVEFDNMLSFCSQRIKVISRNPLGIDSTFSFSTFISD